MLRLPLSGAARNIWGILYNFFMSIFAGGDEYFEIVTNSNNPPTVKANTRFMIYKEDNSYTIDAGYATGDNEYAAGDTPTYPVSQGVIEPSDRTFTWNNGSDFPVQSDGTWYLYCRGCLDTDSTTRGKGSYWISKTDAPAVDYKKGGYYNSADGLSRCLARFTSTSGTVSALILYKVVLPMDSGTSGYMLSSTGDGKTQWVAPSAVSTYPLVNIIGTIANDADTDHDIAFSATTAADSTNTYILSGSAMVKRIDASWSAGTGNGGLFSGTVANSTWYYMFIIRKDSDGTIDYGFDTSSTAANKPAGYTYYRRIPGVLRTNSSANILNFFQKKNKFYWTTPFSDFNFGTITVDQARHLVTTTIPPSKEGLFIINFDAAADNYVFVGSPNVSDYTPDANTSIRPPTSNYQGITMEILVDSSSRIAYRATNTNVTYMGVVNIGFIDDGS